MKIVSLALFGSGDPYCAFLPSFLLAHHNLFPHEEDWRLRIHADDEIATGAHGGFLARLAGEKLIELHRMGESNFTRSMLWRCDPIFDKNVEYNFCRDIDAIPMPRDRACVDQFLASKATISVLHDNIQHIGMLGGLCGFRSAYFRQVTGFKSLDDLYKFAGDVPWAQKGVDQMVLNRVLLAYPQLTLLEHRYAGWHGGEPRMRPSQRIGVYGCKAWSQLVPDEGDPVRVFNGAAMSFDAVGEWTKQADRLGFHLGCAGYDAAAARGFWEKCGDPEIARRLRACEEQ